MCVIVDANVAARVFGDPPAGQYAGLLKWLLGPKGGLAYGGKNAEELARVRGAIWAIRQLRLAGRAYLADKSAVVERTQALHRAEACVSNDEHVVALAQVSGARTLCSEDRDLHEDFTNRALVRDPRGKVYQAGPNHEQLLRHTSGCPARRARR